MEQETYELNLRIHMKRIYNGPVDEVGFRVLIDRLWPRGFRKEAVRLDAWAKDLSQHGELAYATVERSDPIAAGCGNL